MSRPSRSGRSNAGSGGIQVPGIKRPRQQMSGLRISRPKPPKLVKSNTVRKVS